ncbi:hypothetical protein COV12_03385 [Candidatus Woesearchaeota archaeon CG10_big_fil_rev_8_21_14_0_10_32_24]|nr:MAG: hypothetical protein COV12_03385 [Candidatus Woesearchaeota archaeon CG10_big_fil_rev_8_21_14_0_10_32_24]
MLHNHRKKIDELNITLIDLLEKRFEITKEIMSLKDTIKIPRTDLLREQKIIEELQQKSNLDQEFVEKLMKLIFEEAKNA